MEYQKINQALKARHMIPGIRMVPPSSKTSHQIKKWECSLV
jgi:hypothetical protein